MLARTTIISSEENHEIVKIESEISSIIMYSYNNSAIILNGDKDEPYLISVLSKNILLKIIKFQSLSLSIISLLDDITGYKISDTDELYHPSVIALKIANAINENNEIHYSGKRVEFDAETNCYNFDFHGTKISIPFSILYNLIYGTQNSYIYNNSAEIKLVVLPNADNDYIVYRSLHNSTKYVIELNYDNIDLTYIYSYKLFRDGVFDKNNTFADMLISSRTMTVFIKSDDINYKIITDLNDALDLFAGDTNIIKAHILFNNTKINCIIRYEKLYHPYIILVQLVLGANNQYTYNIDMPLKFHNAFKRALIDTLKSASIKTSNGGQKNEE